MDYQERIEVSATAKMLIAEDHRFDREYLGRAVREAWIEWANDQPPPIKPSWLVPWEELSEADKEVDRRIGDKLRSIFLKE